MAQYREVALAYIAGLEQASAAVAICRASLPWPVSLVSRIDSAVDDLLLHKIEADPKNREQLSSLLGKAAIANAKQAYRVFREVFGLTRFNALKTRASATCAVGFHRDQEPQIP